MKIVDTHSHVLYDSYKEELDDVIHKLKLENIVSLNISYNIKSSEEVLKTFKTHKNILPIIGIHPGNNEDHNIHSIKKLESLITKDVIAIGEIGLDYHYDNFDSEKQKEIFIKQIELSINHNLPIIVHTRDSLEDCYEIIKKYPNQKFLLHSWSGDEEMTKKYLSISNKIYFSYNGIITFKNAQLQNRVINLIPKNRIMFETDCPYLSPTPNRGKTNYPWRVKDVLTYCAKKMNITFDQINNLNNENTLSFFSLEKEVIK